MSRLSRLNVESEVRIHLLDTSSESRCRGVNEYRPQVTASGSNTIYGVVIPDWYFACWNRHIGMVDSNNSLICKPRRAELIFMVLPPLDLPFFQTCLLTSLRLSEVDPIRRTVWRRG